jgi:hypothetical protein
MDISITSEHSKLQFKFHRKRLTFFNEETLLINHFALNSWRNAVLLIGWEKTGDEYWYAKDVATGGGFTTGT